MVEGTADQTWSAKYTADPGTGYGDTAAAARVLELDAGTSTDRWSKLTRAIFTFDTSALTGAATISAATFSVEAYNKAENLTPSQSMCLSTSAPTADNALEVADYDYTQFGSTDLAPRIAFAAINTSGYNDFALNATGRAAINKTGITRFGMRHSADMDNTAPTWGSGQTSDVRAYFADQADVTSDPKLVITYTTGGPTYTLTAETGVFTLTGMDADLLHNRVLSAATGSYTLTGSAADLLHNWMLGANTGSFVLTGQDADLLHNYVLGAEAGVFILTGMDAGLYKEYTLIAETGVFTLTGQDADLLHNWILDADPGVFVLTGMDADLIYSALFAGTPGVNIMSVATLPVNNLTVTIADNELSVETLPNNTFEVVV